MGELAPARAMRDDNPMMRGFLLFLASVALSLAAERAPLPPAHAHNDYAHARPLLDALEAGFLSVEADVHLVDGALLVAHDLKAVHPGRTLEALYLEPLRARVKANGGRVFHGGPSLTLLVDVKSEAGATFAVIDATLRNYADLLTVWRDGRVVPGAVTVIVSGNRAIPEITAQAERRVAIDGRGPDLDGAASAALVPWVSENWEKAMGWKWEGAMPAEVKAKLASWVERAHAQGRKVRFWNTPDRAEVWQTLLAAGVDVIGTDNLSGLAEALRPDAASATPISARGVMGAAAAAPGGASAPEAAAALRVMSFNVRYSRAPDGENAWPKRTELFFTTIARFAPDLIGFQEVLADQYDAIAERFPEFALSGVAREDGKRRGEFAAIAYRKSRFTPVANGDFWLSENPAVVGSKSWDAALTRICSWVRLRETATGREFVFANTHFDHQGVVARQEASRVLSEQLAKIAAGVPALLTGDLNVNEDNPAYAVLVAPKTEGAIRWIDAFRAVHPRRQPDEASFHAFKGTIAGARIDFVFHTAHFIATAAEIDRTKGEGGRLPSDHYPVTAVLRWK